MKGKVCLEIHENKVRLKRNHSYYYQIQEQLNITRKSKCYFVVYITDEMDLFVEEIERDNIFWEQKMLPPLSKFYKECIDPEIVRNNIGNGKKCIDPPYILEAIKLYEQKKLKNR
ncbi:hypothetical protein NQ315_008761 [Exocentrus adspersus]|uniref:Uncharacterized protein n=1 Tax=Exocentrus adspersus TaxID=1586481 RepID=A0AAV8VGV3_9CUCU|nr:hypothetical protein NQ315_008761 [Exocentrus adspersus]